MLLWQWFFFGIMLMVQAITTPSLKFFWSTTDFAIDLYGGWQKHANHSTNLWENLLISKDFYKIRNVLEKSQTWWVIAWTISIVQKNFCCHSNMPGGIQFLRPYFAKDLYQALFAIYWPNKHNMWPCSVWLLHFSQLIINNPHYLWYNILPYIL